MGSLRPLRRACCRCGHVHISRVPEGGSRPERVVLRCPSRTCKGRRRAHYPLRRPITGAYHGLEGVR